jgi:hypothetical protein
MVKKQKTLEQNAADHNAPERVKILAEAARLTANDREKTYGGPKANMECLSAYMQVYLHYSGVVGREAFSNGHDAAMFNVLSKLARITVAPQTHKDNYVDGAAYLAIAFEVDTAE